MSLSGNGLGDAISSAITAYFSGLPEVGGVKRWDRADLFGVIAGAYGSYLTANASITITVPVSIGAGLASPGAYEGVLTVPAGDIATTLPATLAAAGAVSTQALWRLVGVALVDRIVYGSATITGAVVGAAAPVPPTGVGGVVPGVLRYDTTTLADAMLTAAASSTGAWAVAMLSHLSNPANQSVAAASPVPIGYSIIAANGTIS